MTENTLPAKRISLLDIITSIGNAKFKTIKLIDWLVGGAIAACLPRRKNLTGEQVTFKKILVIRPGGIGDAVFLVPFLRRLKEKNPQASIDILCEQRNQEIFSSQEGLCSALYRFDKLSEITNLFKNSYDTVIDTEQWHYLSAVISHFLKTQITIGFATRPRRAKLFNYAISYGTNEHELINFRQLFCVLEPSCSDITDIHESFKLPPQTEDWARQQISGQTVTIYLGASISLRRLDKEKNIDLIQYLLSRQNSVALLGGKDVMALSEEVMQGVPRENVLNFTGKTSLLESAALIKQSKLFIGADSGLMHLACAVGTPVIAIFGPGNVNKWQPVGKQHRVVTKNVTCSPCTHLSYTVPTCHGTYHCMRDINSEDIKACIREYSHD